MLHLLYHQGPLGTICLQQDSNHVCLWSGYHLHHDTTKHGYCGVMKESTGEWNGALLPSVMRIGSVYIWAMDIHMYGEDLVSVIFCSAFAHYTHALPQLHGVEATSYNLQSHLVFLQGKVTVPATLYKFGNPVLLSFFDRKVMCFFSRITHIHIWLLWHVFFMVYNNCPGQQDPQISCQSNTYGQDLALPPSLPQPLPNFDNGCKMPGTIYRRMTFSTFMTIYMQEYTTVLPPGRVHCVLLWLFGPPHTVTCVFHLVWICYHILQQWWTTCHINLQYKELVLEGVAFFR